PFCCFSVFTTNTNLKRITCSSALNCGLALKHIISNHGLRECYQSTETKPTTCRTWHFGETERYAMWPRGRLRAGRFGSVLCVQSRSQTRLLGMCDDEAIAEMSLSPPEKSDLLSIIRRIFRDGKGAAFDTVAGETGEIDAVRSDIDRQFSVLPAIEQP